MASLAEIRARLQAAESKGPGQSQGGDNAIYPHWNMDEGHSATLRFLPDSDTKNTFFWVERAMIRLPFAGIKGHHVAGHCLGCELVRVIYTHLNLSVEHSFAR